MLRAHKKKIKLLMRCSLVNSEVLEANTHLWPEVTVPFKDLLLLYLITWDVLLLWREQASWKGLKDVTLWKVRTRRNLDQMHTFELDLWCLFICFHEAEHILSPRESPTMPWGIMPQSISGKMKIVTIPLLSLPLEGDYSQSFWICSRPVTHFGQ